MTTLTAPAPGATAPGTGVSGATPTARVVDRAAPAAVALRLVVLVSGLVVVLADGTAFPLGVALAAVLLAGDAGWRLLRRVPRAGEDAVERLGADTVVSIVAVLASGGWWSPFGAVLAVDLAMVGLARGYRRALLVAVAATGLCLVAGVVGGPVVPAGGTTPLPLLLLLGACLGGYAHGLAVGGDHPDLGHAVHLADANRLVSDLHGTLRSLPTAPDGVTVSRAALAWLRERVPFTAAVVVVRESAGATLVHAEGTAPDADAVDRLVAAAPPAPLVDAPATSTLTTRGRSTAWLPLELRGRSLGLLVIEHEDDLDADEVVPALAELAGPLSLALDTARWFTRLSTLAGELERSRLAGALADRVCQSMATTVFALDRAAARNGDAELFRLADGVRADVADLRRTLDDLRASVEGDAELATVVAGCVDRAGERGGFLTILTVEASERPSRAVEQQVLRALQELLAALEDATAVDVRWRSDADALVLAIDHDGRLDPPVSVATRADAIGATVSTNAVTGGVVVTLVTQEVRP